MADPVLSARSRFNATRQYRGENDPATVAAARDLAAEKMAAYVSRVVTQAPPLTEDQRSRIARLLSAAEPEAAAG